MVGVAGRSKGCKTCKRRKVNCDAIKPYCKRCSSTGRQCEGYETKSVFVAWTNNDNAKEPRLNELKTAVTSCPRDDSESWSALPASPASSSMWTAQITELFFDSILSTVDSFNHDVGILWLREAYKISFPSHVLDHAMKALAATRVSWQTCDPDLLIFAQHSYCRALQALQKAIQDSDEVYHDHTFLAVRTMAMYESLASTSNDTSSWKIHIDGLTMLLQARGPRPFTSISGRAALEDIRDSIMTRTAMDRKSSFIGSGAWANLSWIDNIKPPRQHVADVGFRIASLLEYADTVFPPFETTPYRQRIAIDILDTSMACLYQFDAIDLENRTATGEEYELSFKNLQSAIATLNFWALSIYMRLLVIPLLKMLEGDLDLSLDHQETRDLITSIRNRLCQTECRRICRKIHAGARFCLREEMRYIGSRRLIFPLLSASYFLRQYKLPELQECQRLTKLAIEDRGIRMGSHIRKGISKKFSTFGYL